jgi:hypothetical protein
MSREESHRKHILKQMEDDGEDKKIAGAIEFGKVYIFTSVYNEPRNDLHQLIGIVERVNLRTLKTKIIATDSKSITEWANSCNGYHTIPYQGISTYKEVSMKDLPLYINHVFTKNGKKIFSESSLNLKKETVL